MPLATDRDDKLAATRMVRIEDPDLDHRTPGIVTLVQAGPARPMSPWASGLLPARRASRSASPRQRLWSMSCWKRGTSGGSCACTGSWLAIKLLIIDELGYVPLSTTGAELLFEVFSRRYERGSVLVTSNLPFDEWTSVFGSERLDRRLARPAHPPRPHPRDERRQLSSQTVRRPPPHHRRGGAKPGHRERRPRSRRDHHSLIRTSPTPWNGARFGPAPWRHLGPSLACFYAATVAWNSDRR